MISRSRTALLLLLTLVTVVVVGCASTESENASSRPWNAPQAWETGALPSAINQGR